MIWRSVSYLTNLSLCGHFKPGGEIRVKCLGTIAAEFWEDDVENVYTKVGPSYLLCLPASLVSFS